MSLGIMLEYWIDWKEEFERIVLDVYGCTIAEYCDINEVTPLFKIGYSPHEAFEAIEESSE